MIIDTHQHLGRSRFTGQETTEVELLEGMQANGLDVALVMPQSTLDSASTDHDRIAALARIHPDSIRGVASICPWISEEEYRIEATRCVRDLNFVALKLDPNGHGLAINSAQARRCFETASDLGVPIIVHTGFGVPNSLPSLALPVARAFPRLPIILAHAGFATYAADALVAAREAQNIYLEPSWCTVFQVRDFHRALGPTRLLFGTDHVANMPVELAKFRSAGIPEMDLDCIFETTARGIFNL